MKVKELAENLKTTTVELINKLSNVIFTEKITEEYEVSKDLEKKLAKMYGVAYPFKSNKPKSLNKPAVRIGSNKQEDELKSKSFSNQKSSKSSISNNPKPVSNSLKSSEKKENQKNSVIQTNNNSHNNNKQQPKTSVKPQSRPKYVEEIIVPRVDEKILEKYGDYLEEDEYNLTRETRSSRVKKTGSSENITDMKQRKKNSNKNKNNNAKKEKRTSNMPSTDKLEDHVLYYENGMSVMEVANGLGVSVTELVKKLFVSMGIMASATQTLDRDTIELIAIEYDFELKDKKITDMTRFDELEVEDKEEDLVSRPAIVTIMGHVDHGKTTLLDTIRSSHVVTGEAGGITQHIGAYQVVKNNKTITFIDTPGHAAFTEMRARGAQITDIVVLVVASDDGVMPQTKEAIEHAQAAGVPIIVAVNKMDKPGANPDRVKTELTEYSLVSEDWGGDTIFVNISALTGKGVDELLEMIILVSDLKDYKANPNRLGIGTVIEARLDKGRGPIATLLVQNGTIKVGDIIVVGTTYGKVRSMEDELGRSVSSAGPSKPVSVTGLVEVPFAGEKFMVLNDERKAREIAEVRAQNKFNEEKGVGKAASLTDLFKNENADKTLNLIIKCDVQGSIEAIKGLLEKINIDGTNINIIGARVGGITNNDIILAVASKAIIVGFNVRPTSQISDFAKEQGVEIRLYNIIYKLQEDIEKAVKGLLDPVFEEKITGQAEVREIFKVSRVGTIAGSYVTSGTIFRNGGVRLIRDSIVIYTGKMAGLRRFKDDVKEVKSGYECGITIENYNDIKVGDIIECFIMEEAERE
ncbi:MAG: translation initiation factor IF-2 [Staphylococcus sp.]|jgi:translation initiation factor IF-2|nr:translation initiation factor IF-2 [Staphylococcus sp.]